MNGYHILGGAPPYQVLQQQNAGLPPGSVPPWYAMQYPAGYVPPLLVSVDNPLEEDPFDVYLDDVRFRGERDRRDLLRSHLTHLMGIDAVGAFDVAASQRQMNNLKQVTVNIARALLRGGQDAINSARTLAAESWTRPALPRGAARDEIYWKLDWHARELAKATDSGALYAPGGDLKIWVQRAFEEFNAAEEGRNASERSAQVKWGAMWTAIGEALANLPANVAAAVIAIPNAIVKGTTGLPLWAWSAAALAAVGLLGFAAYKILLAAAPTAGRAALTKYIPALGGTQ